MALVSVNPVRKEREPSALEKVAMGLGIAKDVLGIATVPGQISREKEKAALDRATTQAGLLGKFEPVEGPKPVTLPGTMGMTVPGEGITGKAPEGAFEAPTDLASALKLQPGQMLRPRGEAPDRMKQLKLQEMERKTGPVTETTRTSLSQLFGPNFSTEGMTEGDALGLLRSKAGALVLDQPEKPSAFSYAKSFEDVPAGTPGAVTVELDTGEVKTGIKRQADAKITPEGILKQVETLEDFFDDMEDDPLFRSNFIPVIGQMRQVAAEKFRLDDPKSAEFFATLGAAILDFTKSKQGSRPSDFDLQFIREFIFPTRGDLPEIAKAKFSAVKNMIKAMQRNPDKPVKDILDKVSKQLPEAAGAGAPDLTGASDEDLFRMIAE